MFFPVLQNPEANTVLLVRSQLPPAEVAPALNRMLTGIDSTCPSRFTPGQMRWRWCCFQRASPRRRWS
jgi:hypothetical protein